MVSLSASITADSPGFRSCLAFDGTVSLPMKSLSKQHGGQHLYLMPCVRVSVRSAGHSYKTLSSCLHVHLSDCSPAYLSACLSVCLCKAFIVRTFQIRLPGSSSSSNSKRDELYPSVSAGESSSYQPRWQDRIAGLGEWAHSGKSLANTIEHYH